MAQKTYLQLVNEAMAEAKISVDPLTSVNFATNNSSLMYARFREWVNQSYEELLMDRPEWRSRTERATAEIRPRLHLAGLSVLPTATNEYEGDSSGVTFTVDEVHAHEDVETDATTEATISVTFDEPDDARLLILRENINTVTVDASWTSGHFKGWGQYDFSDIITGLSEIHPDSVRVREYNEVGETDENTDLTKVHFIPYSAWKHEWNLNPLTGERPLYMTKTPQGFYDFYPKPRDLVVLSFDFTRSFDLLSDYDDVPVSIPDSYHTYLMWAAVQKYADWDKQGTLYMRATKYMEKYRNWMERDLLPEVGFIGWNGVHIRG